MLHSTWTMTDSISSLCSGGASQSVQRESDLASVDASNAVRQKTDNSPQSNFHTDLPVFMPNAPSEPVWSLSAEVRPRGLQQEDTPPERQPDRPLSTKAAEQSEAATMAPEPVEIVAPEPRQPETPPSPPRRGWWQRPFRERE